MRDSRTQEAAVVSMATFALLLSFAWWVSTRGAGDWLGVAQDRGQWSPARGRMCDVESGEQLDPSGDIWIDIAVAIEPAPDGVPVLASSSCEFVHGPTQNHEA